MHSILPKSPLLPLLAMALVGIAPGDSSAQSPARVFRVEVGVAREIQVVERLDLTGSVEAWREIRVPALASGAITALPAEEGMRVEKGALLFEVDPREQRATLAGAKAELDKARAQLEKMEAGSLPEEIRRARKNADAARARLQVAREDWERVRPLLEEGIVSPSEASRARSASDAAEAEMEQAEAALRLVEDGFRSEEVRTAAAEVRVRQAVVDRIEKEIADRTVVAPEGGVVVARLKEQGEWAAEGETILEMVVLDPVRVRLEAPQARVGRLRPGMAAEVTVDGLDRALQGEILAVVPRAASGSRNFPVLLRVANPDGRLSAGMFARARVEVGERRTDVAIPRAAIQYRGNRLAIYRLDPLPADFIWKPPPAPPGPRAAPPSPPPEAIAREIEVEIVEEHENELVVRAVVGKPPDAGDRVVVFGGSLLQEGSLLSPISAPGSAGGAGALPGAG